MSRYSGNDPYLDPTTGVLKNRLNIADETSLEQTEADIVAARSYELSRTPLKGRFDLAHLQAIHKYLFGDLYEWAGQLRTIDISKGGNRFAHHGHIESAAASVFQQLAKENRLAGLGPAGFSDRAAYYLGELTSYTLSAKATDERDANLSVIWRTQTVTTSRGKTSVQPSCWPPPLRPFTATRRLLAGFIRRNLSAFEQGG